MQPKTQRMYLIIAAIILVITATFIILNNFRDNIVFFYSPTDINTNKNIPIGKTIRIGGLVAEGSVVKSDNSQLVSFAITDLQHSIEVKYEGILPNLFREGQGMVAQGVINQDGSFTAIRLLAKHDENYMPPEVYEALKKSGKWQGQN